MFAQSLCPLPLAPAPHSTCACIPLEGRWAGEVAGVPTSSLPFFPEKEGWQVAPLAGTGTCHPSSLCLALSWVLRGRMEGGPGETTAFPFSGTAVPGPTQVSVQLHWPCPMLESVCALAHCALFSPSARGGVAAGEHQFE